MPKSYMDDSLVRLVHGDGATFVAEEQAHGNSFDRVGSRLPPWTRTYMHLLIFLSKRCSAK